MHGRHLILFGGNYLLQGSNAAVPSYETDFVLLLFEVFKEARGVVGVLQAAKGMRSSMLLFPWLGFIFHCLLSTFPGFHGFLIFCHVDRG